MNNKAKQRDYVLGVAEQILIMNQPTLTSSQVDYLQTPPLNNTIFPSIINLGDTFTLHAVQTVQRRPLRLLRNDRGEDNTAITSTAEDHRVLGLHAWQTQGGEGEGEGVGGGGGSGQWDRASLGSTRFVGPPSLSPLLNTASISQEFSVGLELSSF